MIFNWVRIFFIYTLMNVIRTFVIQKVFLLLFTIFIFMEKKGQNETQVKLIIITYLNKIVVSHTIMR